ncbi:LysR family transcriptional regulator [Stenotrophomonas maltophilia]|nr:LysR family transcriptional regulator [Stenotrophomonas maltophilia]MBH1823266.1 LysR family transcriptional regulator [Stenotrophomonas maltophilia]
MEHAGSPLVGLGAQGGAAPVASDDPLELTEAGCRLQAVASETVHALEDLRSSIQADRDEQSLRIRFCAPHIMSVMFFPHWIPLLCRDSNQAKLIVESHTLPERLGRLDRGKVDYVVALFDEDDAVAECFGIGPTCGKLNPTPETDSGRQAKVEESYRQEPRSQKHLDSAPHTKIRIPYLLPCTSRRVYSNAMERDARPTRSASSTPSRNSYRRESVYLKSQDEEGIARNYHVGPDFDRMYCTICGAFTEAFNAQVETAWPLGFVGRLHHWPLQDGLRVLMPGLSRRLCSAHACRDRVNNNYGSQQQVHRRQESSRAIMLAAMSMKYPELTYGQSIAMVRTLTTSRSAVSYYGGRQVEAVISSTPERRRLLASLGVSEGPITRPESLRSIHISHDRLRVLSSRGEDWQSSHEVGRHALEKFNSLEVQIKATRQFEIGADGMLLDLPDLLAYARIEDHGITIDFRNADLWGELEELVSAYQLRRLALHDIQTVHQILSA